MLPSTPVGTHLVPRTLFLYIPAAHGLSYVRLLSPRQAPLVIRIALDGLSEQELSWELPVLATAPPEAADLGIAV